MSYEVRRCNNLTANKFGDPIPDPVGGKPTCFNENEIDDWTFTKKLFTRIIDKKVDLSD